MDWKQLLVHITDSVDAELRLRNEYLAVENRILRKQINGRVQMTNGDRRALAALGQKLGRKVLEEIATVATPNTLLAWHRQFVDQKFDGAQQRQTPGRPKVDPDDRGDRPRAWRKRTARGAMIAWSGP